MLINRFVSWWRNGEYSPTGTCSDIGMTTRAALARFEHSGDPIAVSRAPDAAGNGSFMRLAQVAAYGLSAGVTAMREAARIQSSTTHAARACLDACETRSVIIHAAIGGSSSEDAMKVASNLDLTTHRGDCRWILTR
ncbi:MAG: ADP-ribosylglycohydrolase family protein [Erythrobacter sp.]|nr:ADP-ribosylglycohydrolase family protein [Erythrobacter sp.]